MRTINQTLKVITLALILSVGISYVSAWTTPTATPPGGNVAAPISISGTDQIKSGSIGAASFLDSNDPNNFFVNPNGDSKLKNIFTTGNVGVGVTAPNWPLTVGSSIEGNALGVSSAGDIVVTGGSDRNWALYKTDAGGTPQGIIGINPGNTTVSVTGDIKASGDVCNGTTCLSAVGGGVPSGSLCGSFVNDTMWGTGWGAFAQCQGMNGWSGCPAGYTFRATSYDQYNGAANYFYSCVKN